MPQTVRLTGEIANSPRVKSGPSRGHKVHQILPFELLLREIWPQDRTKNYMRATGAAEKTAKRRVGGKHPPKGYEEIVALLRSEQGFRFLKRMMGDARPQWFAAVERAKHLGDIRRQQAMLQRRLAQLEMEIE